MFIFTNVFAILDINVFSLWVTLVMKNDKIIMNEITQNTKHSVTAVQTVFNRS